MGVHIITETIVLTSPNNFVRTTRTILEIIKGPDTFKKAYAEFVERFNDSDYAKKGWELCGGITYMDVGMSEWMDIQQFICCTAQPTKKVPDHLKLVWSQPA